jgi:hypothetical protein
MHYSLHHPFACALHDAFFVFDPDDKVAVEVFLASKGVT